MRIVTFEIPGPPVGYTIQLGRFANTKVKQKYREFKKLVQSLAPIQLPLVASREKPVIVETECFFVNGIHPDPENVHKGVKDALFWVKSGMGKGAGDKYTGGHYEPPQYDKLNPRTIVTVCIPE